ncbi:glycosyltransferase [Echinicola marina]|uniref:glycosyltransferase family protein n=1 Tax=Echinicola marina TaxID=2859768 RepID=UPI001CF66149|nr:glycosyltransferase family protein [Echinicola marina]UCS91510.1 glycosyltransferase [Echinicola marina]
MKFIFIVQGEGRGHMTQAIALSTILAEQGHEVSHVLIGKSKRRQLPEFVRKNLKAPITQFESPNFHTDNKGKSINLFKTITKNILRSQKFIHSFQIIDRVIKADQPNIIINFYDMLAGLYNFTFRPKAAFWTIGHQYLIYHSSFPFAPNSLIQKKMFQFNTAITALGADKLLALSFRDYPKSAQKKLIVIPPVLRSEIHNLTTTEGDYILSYIVNPGYAEEIISFGKENPEIKIEAFWDQKDSEKVYHPHSNITFHQIDDHKFLEKMANCKGLICTAGFESVCEAMYLGKQVMMVPVSGQYEQACNAIDAQNAQAGLAHHSFDFKLFSDYLNSCTKNDQSFIKWQQQLPKMIEKIIEYPNSSSFQ